MPKVKVNGKVKHFPYTMKGKAMAKKAMDKNMTKAMAKKAKAKAKKK